MTAALVVVACVVLLTLPLAMILKPALPRASPDFRQFACAAKLLCSGNRSRCLTR